MAAILLAAILMCLISCNENNGNENNGITITDDTPYSDSTVESAKSTVRSLIEAYYKSSVSQSIPPNMANKISKMADKIVEITAEKPMAEELYLEFLGELGVKGGEAMDELLAFKEAGEGSLEKTKRLYLTLTSMLGSEYVGETLYEIIIYVYDYRYEDRITKYEQYGYSYLKQEAEQLSREKSTLINEVGRTEFSRVLRLSLALSEIFLGGGFDADKMSSFSNEEILVFIKNLGVSDVNISADGWELLLSKVLPDEAGESYSSKILAKIKENGDTDVLKYAVLYVMDTLKVLERLTADDISVIRDGDPIRKTELIFSKFGENEWSNIEKTGALQFKVGDYNQIASTVYGSDFEAYVQELTPVNAEQLRLSVGEENFEEMLINYIAAICPAFGYLK